MGNFNGGKKFPLIFVIFYVVVIIPKISSSSLIPQSEPENNNQKYNLNSSCDLNAIPIRYNIHIDPIQVANEIKTEQPKSTVSAWVKVLLKVGDNNCKFSNNSSIIKIHTRSCKIDFENVNVTRKRHGGCAEPLKISAPWFEENNNSTNSSETKTVIHVIRLEDSMLVAGDFLELHIPYEFQLTRENGSQKTNEFSSQGLYYYDARGVNTSNYLDIQNYLPMRTKYMFPIVDHHGPLNKSIIKLSAARSHADGFISISNMDIVESTSISGMDGWIRDNFRESSGVPIQLEQVTLMILQGFQNFTVYETNTKNNKSRKTNLWAYKSQYFEKFSGEKAAIGTAQEISSLMSFFEDQLNKTYPINKIDFVAVPWKLDCDQSNLGLVVSSESAMIPHRDTCEQDVELQRFSLLESVTRNQVASQWFRGMIGTRVPLKKDDPNRFRSYPTQDELDRSFVDKILMRYVSKWAEAYKYPSGGGEDIHDRKVISLHILESVLSRKVMKSAIVDYYLPKRYSTDKDDVGLVQFYDSIQQAIDFHNVSHLLPAAENNVTVERLLDTWTNRNFHPVTIKISEEKVDNSTFCISLYRYPSLERYTDADNSKHTWWMPVTILAENGEQIVWVSPNHTSQNSSVIWCKPLGFDSGNNWLFAHVAYTLEFYNVKYNNYSFLNNVINQLNKNHTVIPPEGRYYLMNEWRNLNDNDWENIRDFLELSKYLGNETDLSVWSVVLDKLESQEFPFKFSAIAQEYFFRKMNSVLDQIGRTPISGESTTYPWIRSKFMRVCNSYDLPACREYAWDTMIRLINNTKGNPFSDMWGLYKSYFVCEAMQSPSESLNGHPIFNYFLNDLWTYQDVEFGNDHIFFICVLLPCVNNDTLFASLLGSNSTLARSKNVQVKECYRYTLPWNILGSERLHSEALVEAAVDNKMRLALSSGVYDFLSVVRSLIRRKKDLPGVVQKVLKFFDDHKELFSDEYTADQAKDITTKLSDSTSYDIITTSTDKAKHEIDNKMDAWIKSNS